ncbi:MAG: HAD family hydrolase [Bacteroidota bacterium]
MAIKGVVFDLDDTLYLERDYIWSGFRHVAKTAHKTTGCSERMIYEHLRGIFDRGMRGRTFNLLLETYQELARHFLPDDLVRIYREHQPLIEPVPGAMELVESLKKSGRLVGLLTDGPLSSQNAKIAALNLAPILSPIVITDRWGREYWKPHPRGFEFIANAWRISPNELAYIGDNPEKDFIGAKSLGWFTIRLRLEGQLHLAVEPRRPEASPHVQCHGISELQSLLETRSFR